MIRRWVILALPILLPTAIDAQQTEADGYTRYELLLPGSGKFRIFYETTATTPGATVYYNPIRPGSIATDERVTDRATGRPLAWDVVDSGVARAAGLTETGDIEQFLRVKLARAVPAGDGEARILIDKTYEDPKSYFVEGTTIVFDRSLGIKRNAVVLPAGYRLVTANYPAQIARQADGRIVVSFWNATPATAPLRLTARPGKTSVPAAPIEDERAHQSREIVYYLNPPETHSFALTHDYTEERAGVSTYVNVVRPGSTVSKPSARNLDTGETLAPELLSGAEVIRAAPEAKAIGGADPHAVLFRFPSVRAGESTRLRIAETYTDAKSYTLAPDGSLVWERTLGRPANAVVLPTGWTVVSSSMPATLSETADGRARLDFINPRPDELAVRIVARQAN